MGDRFISHQNEAIVVEGIRETTTWERVYNLRIADHHTYFVGCDQWGFSVWAHNAECSPQLVTAAAMDELGGHFKGFPRGLAEQVAEQMRLNTAASRAEAVRLLQKAEGGLEGVGAKRAEAIVANLENRMIARAGVAGSTTEAGISAASRSRTDLAALAQRTEASNAGVTAVFHNGYYEINGFRFSEYYYHRLWTTGRPSPGRRAEAVLRGSPGPVPNTRDARPGFLRYEHDGWEMIYNPTTREVWHLQPMHG